METRKTPATIREKLLRFVKINLISLQFLWIVATVFAAANQTLSDCMRGYNYYELYRCIPTLKYM